jgi:hypothetical protein
MPTASTLVGLLAAVVHVLPTHSQAHVPGQVCHSWVAQRCQPPPAVSVWPQPVSLETTIDGAVPLGVSRLTLKCGHHSDDVLQSAIERYTAIIRGTSTVHGTVDHGTVAPDSSAAVVAAELATLTIEVVEDSGLILNATLLATMNESYTLTVNETGAVLRAPTTVGALRGLETFAQLIDFAQSPPMIAQTPIGAKNASF